MTFAAAAPIIAAGVSAGGSLLGGMFGASGAAGTNAQQFANAELMFDQTQTANQHFLDQQQGYNTMMANTAYQRSMADMKAAGLNPILAAGGNVTSVGSGGSASMSPVGTPGFSNPGEHLGRGIASASQAAQVYQQVKQQMAQTDQARTQADLNVKTGDATDATKILTNENTKKATQDTATSAANETAAKAAAANQNADTANKGILSGILGEQRRSAKAEADLKELERDTSKSYGPGAWGHMVNTIVRTLMTGANTVAPKGSGEQLEKAVTTPMGNSNENPNQGLTIDMRKK